VCVGKGGGEDWRRRRRRKDLAHEGEVEASEALKKQKVKLNGSSKQRGGGRDRRSLIGPERYGTWQQTNDRPPLGTAATVALPFMLVARPFTRNPNPTTSFDWCKHVQQRAATLLRHVTSIPWPCFAVQVSEFDGLDADVEVRRYAQALR